jgi:hypothetical protein
LADVPILCSECVLDGVESDDLLEVVEHAIARRGVREISERSVSAVTVSVTIQNILDILTAKTRWKQLIFQ